MRGQRDQNHHVHQVGASNYPSSVAGGPVQLFLPSTASGRPLRFAAPQHFEYEDGDDAEDYKDRERGEGHVSEWLNHGSSGSIDDGHLGPETDRSGRQDESNGGDDGADKDEKAVKRRSSKACDSCRRQKCKCERDPNSRGGQCAHCEALGVECTFKDQSKKRGPPKGYIEAIETRLNRMEQLLYSLVMSPDPRARELLMQFVGSDIINEILRGSIVLCNINEPGQKPGGRGPGGKWKKSWWSAPLDSNMRREGAQQADGAFEQGSNRMGLNGPVLNASSSSSTVMPLASPVDISTNISPTFPSISDMPVGASLSAATVIPTGDWATAVSNHGYHDHQRHAHGHTNHTQETTLYSTDSGETLEQRHDSTLANEPFAYTDTQSAHQHGSAYRQTSGPHHWAPSVDSRFEPSAAEQAGATASWQDDSCRLPRLNSQTDMLQSSGSVNHQGLVSPANVGYPTPHSEVGASGSCGSQLSSTFDLIDSVTESPNQRRRYNGMISSHESQSRPHTSSGSASSWTHSQSAYPLQHSTWLGDGTHLYHSSQPEASMSSINTLSICASEGPSTTPSFNPGSQVRNYHADAAPLAGLSEGVGHLSLDEHGDLHYIGPSSGLPYILKRSMSEGDQWSLPNTQPWSHFEEDTVTPAHTKLIGLQLSDAVNALPGMSTQDKLLKVYWSYVHPAFPAIHKSQFLQQLHAFRAGGSMLGISSAEMCLMLFTMFAIAARHLQKSSKVGSFDSTGWSTGEEYADLSTRLLLNNVATNTLPGIQAQLLLAYYRSGMGSLFMSSLNMGMLVRKAFDLGLHRDMDHWPGAARLGEETKEMRKRLWQGAVIMDAYVAMFTGHSSCIAENEFDAKPASVEKLEEYEPWTPFDEDNPAQSPEIEMGNETRSYALSYYDRFASLAAITLSIKAKLYSINQTRRSEYPTLEQELTSWLASLPKCLQCDMNDTHREPPHILVLHMSFYNALIMLHRPFSATTTLRCASHSRTDSTAHNICTMAANAIADLTETFMRTQNITQAPVFLTFYLRTATIQLLNEASRRPGSASLGTSFAICMSALKSMSVTWPSAGQAHDLLADLSSIASCQTTWHPASHNMITSCTRGEKRPSGTDGYDAKGSSPSPQTHNTPFLPSQLHQRSETTSRGAFAQAMSNARGTSSFGSASGSGSGSGSASNSADDAHGAAMLHA